MSSAASPALGKRLIEVARAVDTVDVGALLVHLPADARVDEERPLAAHEQRPHAEADPVPLVGGRALSQSGFGTTPNIAPPSRRNVPSLRA